MLPHGPKSDFLPIVSTTEEQPPPASLASPSSQQTQHPDSGLTQHAVLLSMADDAQPQEASTSLQPSDNRDGMNHAEGIRSDQRIDDHMLVHSSAGRNLHQVKPPRRTKTVEESGITKKKKVIGKYTCPACGTVLTDTVAKRKRHEASMTHRSAVWSNENRKSRQAPVPGTSLRGEGINE